MRYKVVLSYDGTPFCGWQRQPNGNSVQEEVENAVFKLFGERAAVVASGRTDAGVHALGQVAHFDCAKELDGKNVVGGLNAYLPRTVRVLSGDKTRADFHARYDTVQKTYMYLMYTGAAIPPLNDRALCLGYEPDVEKMQSAANALLGKHDFSTFAASGGGAKTFTRTVTRARFETDGKFIKFFISADGFLYNMVRIITAQLLKAGRGIDIDMLALIEKRDRSYAKELAPAHGLYLYSAKYGPEI